MKMDEVKKIRRAIFLKKTPALILTDDRTKRQELSSSTQLQFVQDSRSYTRTYIMYRVLFVILRSQHIYFLFHRQGGPSKVFQ